MIYKAHWHSIPKLKEGVKMNNFHHGVTTYPKYKYITNSKLFKEAGQGPWQTFWCLYETLQFHTICLITESNELRLSIKVKHNLKELAAKIIAVKIRKCKPLKSTKSYIKVVKIQEKANSTNHTSLPKKRTRRHTTWAVTEPNLLYWAWYAQCANSSYHRAYRWLLPHRGTYKIYTSVHRLWRMLSGSQPEPRNRHWVTSDVTQKAPGFRPGKACAGRVFQFHTTE